MARNRPKRATAALQNRKPGPSHDPGGEISRMRRELEEARKLLQQVELGATADGRLVVARRMAALEEERQVARGQAVDAVLARSKAEAELKALRDAIRHAPGVHGWLLRRAAKKL
jgi:hypothetical protein